MKKAKRLLAVILAAIMIASAACLPVYARKGGTGGESDYTRYAVNDVGKYTFTVEQGCTYILDMLDQMLAEANLYMPWSDLLGDGFGMGIVADIIESATDIDALNLTSIDNTVDTVDRLLDALNDGLLGTIANWGTAAGDIGLLAGTEDKITRNIKRGTNPGYQDGNYDTEVLNNVINWLASLDAVVAKIASGTLDLGWLSGALDSGDIGDILFNLPTWLNNFLYQTLIDSKASEAPAGMNVDAQLQQLINWALIDGTGEDAANGANSLLGPDFEAFLPVIAQQPGGASIGNEKIMADHDGDGKAEEHTMSFYQLVSNAIQALLGGMLKDLLQGVLFDALDVDPTAFDGHGDPDIVSDEMFGIIVGAVEGLCVQNGAPAIVYTDIENTYPVDKINRLLDWFFMPGGGLETLIKFDYQGVHVQDNFMSLLNDLARMAPGLIGSLLEMELPESIVYPNKELNKVMYYSQEGQVRTPHTLPELGVSYDDNNTIDAMFDKKLYLSYEKDADGNQYVLYGTKFGKDLGGKDIVTEYSYLNTGVPIGPEINETFVRPCYEIPTSKVWASLLKVLLNDMIDGCYFPEWADSIASAGAYALASMAATILPEENFIERLDRYHYEQIGQTYKFVNADKDYPALPYTQSKADPTGRTAGTTVPKAAMDIAASIGAFYLNGEFDFLGKKLTTHNTSLEQFLFEMVYFVFTKYLPILAGTYNASTGYFADGAFATAVNAAIGKVYSDPKNRIYKDDANFDCIYEMLNATLFSLLPSDWLPAKFDGSFAFLNDWLLNSVLNIDIQKIISLLSVNENGELSNSVTQVLLNIVARVLAAVFGKTAILPAGSGDLFSTKPTSVTSFAQLLSGDTLAAFLTNLLHALNTKKVILENTIFPLILSQNFTPKYNESYLGSDKTSKKIADLQDYIDSFDKDVNGVPQSGDVYFAKVGEAKAAAKAVYGDETRYTPTIRESKQYFVVTFPASYTSADAAEAAAKFFEDGYATSYNDVHYVYAARDYKDSAATKTAQTDKSGSYSEYSGFNYAHLAKTRSTNAGKVEYNSDIRSLAPEDFKSAVHFYNGYSTAIDNAKDFVDDYNSVANDLAKGYQQWSTFMVEAQLYAKGLYDSNGDGVVNDSDTTPSVPSAFYPYYTTDSVSWKFYDSVNQGIIGRNTAVNMNEFNSGNYEFYSQAVALGDDPKNDIVLPITEEEEVARLALSTIQGFNALQFDITKNAAGAYTGSIQWENLSDTQLGTIASFCAPYGYTFTYGDGNYQITKKAFAPITDSWSFGISGVATRPVVFSGDEDYTQEVKAQICTSYDKYVDAMYNTRLGLYNQIDELGKRVEEAEGARTTKVDLTSLLWALDYTKSAYINTASQLRNKQIAGVVSGEIVYTKVYTSNSYAAFQDAYDFAQSVSNYAGGSLSATGLTQSIISSAYMGLIKAYQALMAFSGEADWELLDSYIALARSLVENGNPEGDLGYEQSTFDALVSELGVAVDMRENSGYDCESNDIIKSEADDLYGAITSLVFRVAPNIIPTEESDIVIKKTGGTETSVEGQIFNLEEGVGLTKELVKIIGMYEDEDRGKTVEVKQPTNGKGYGTGAYIVGKIQKSQPFFYTAVIYGDINGDARIDGTDMAAIKFYCITGQNNLSGMGSAAKLEAADVDHDGDVDLDDAKAIEDHYNYVEGKQISQNPEA